MIDKDAASALLAAHLKADLLVISTGVDKVAVNFGKPDQRDLDTLSVAEARRYLKQGQFAPGSMKPKIEAALYFLRHGGRTVIITQPHLLEQAVAGRTGTHIAR